MSRRIAAWIAAGCALAALGACEKEQTLDAGAKQVDAKAWEANTGPFVARGWKSTGDRAAWEAQLRHRAQAQNDYSR